MSDRRSEGGPVRVAVTDLLGETSRLIGGNAAEAGGAIALLSLLGALVDTGVAGAGLNLLASVLTVFIQYRLTVALLDRAGLRNHADPRFAAFFGLGLLTGIAILAGLVLLVVPGLILMVRWWASGPALIAANQSITEAMTDSWQRTADHFWPILAAVLIVYVPALAAALLLWGALPESLAAIVGANISLYVGLVAGWHLAVAVYRLTGPHHPGVAEVFA